MTRAGEKVLTTILASACGVLFVLAVAMQFGLGRGYHWNDAELNAGDNANGSAIDRDPFQLPPQSDFAAISQRPLFNDDRKPVKDEATDSTPDTPPSPLNISLTGTLLVGKPESRMAMVRENGKAQTIALKEGMPLPGDQGTWTLSQVKNRSAIFKSTAGEEVEVELAVASAGQKPGPQSRTGGAGTSAAAAAAAANRAANALPTGPVSTQSEELQRRIEERRKQMREAAERMKAERQGGEPVPPPPPNPAQQRQ
jgi:general secretion pathway protein N